MGKRTRSRRKGHSLKYRAMSHRHVGVATYPHSNVTVNDIIHNTTKNTPLLEVKEGTDRKLMLAAEGVSTGQTIEIGNEAKVAVGNVVPLKNIPEGVPIFNIENTPGDNGSFIRSGGTFGLIISKGNSVVVELPSKKRREFNPNCLATIGVAAGGGRTDKPFVKAGKKWHRMKAKGRLFPVTRPDSMNPVDHPFGGRTKKGRPMNVPRTAPPGQKVGSFGARSMGGRNKRKAMKNG